MERDAGEEGRVEEEGGGRGESGEKRVLFV